MNQTALHSAPSTQSGSTHSASSESVPVRSVADDVRHQQRIRRAIEKNSFATLATTSPAGRSHSAGIIYATAGGKLWIHTMRSSRKARNVAENPHVGMCIVYRRLPVGPPFTIHFQATAEIVAMDDPSVTRLLDADELGLISGHGALDMVDGCFIAITPRGTIHSYGPGARIIDLIRDPLNTGARRFPLVEGSRT